MWLITKGKSPIRVLWWRSDRWEEGERDRETAAVMLFTHCIYDQSKHDCIEIWTCEHRLVSRDSCLLGFWCGKCIPWWASNANSARFCHRKWKSKTSFYGTKTPVTVSFHNQEKHGVDLFDLTIPRCSVKVKSLSCKRFIM